MKKVMALVLSLMLLLGGTAVLAEDTIPEIVFDETAAAYEGAWMDLGVGLMMYLPMDWNIMEVTEEQQAVGVIALLASADGTQALSVTYGEAADGEGNALEDNAAVMAMLTAGGYTGVMELSINGLSMVGYEVEASNAAGMALLDGEGGMIAFSFAPANDEAAKVIGQTMFFSLSAVEGEEAEEN